VVRIATNASHKPTSKPTVNDRKAAGPDSAATDDEARDVVRFGGQHGVLADKSGPKFQVHRRGGRRSRDKGARGERALASFLQAHGFAAEKISGMYRPGADLSVPILGLDRAVEVKVRSHGFQQLYAWLVERDFLVVRQDRREPLVVVPLRLAIEIARVAERGKATS
jgi:hypothetical protein